MIKYFANGTNVNYRIKFAQWGFNLSNFVLDLISKIMPSKIGNAKILSLDKLSDWKYFYKIFSFINKTLLFIALVLAFATGFLGVLTLDTGDLLLFGSIDFQKIFFYNNLFTREFLINSHHLFSNIVMWLIILHVLFYALSRYKLYKKKQNKVR